MKSVKKIVTPYLFPTVLLFVTGNAIQCQITFNKDSLDAKLREWLPNISATTPGYTIAVISQGKTVYQECLGSADLENNIAISDNTVFNVGSVSKQFTAFLVLQLEQEGKLHTDDLVGRHLSDYRIFSIYPIRITDLLHHTSGLPEILELLELSYGQDKYGYTTENVRQILRRITNLNFEPGQSYQYINTNYFLLSEIIEKVAGRSYPDLCEERIFKPLGMQSSFVMNDFKKLVPAIAKAYIQNAAGAYTNAVPLDQFYGANGVHLSINDFTKWASNLVTRKIGNEALYKKFFSKGLLKGKPSMYGFGLMINEYKGFTFIDHNGGRLGFRSQILYVPDKNFAVVALANLRSFPIVAIPTRVADYLLNLVVPGLKSSPVPVKFDTAYKPKNFSKYIGVYWNRKTDIIRKIYYREGGLIYYREQGNESRLVPEGPGSFYLKLKDSLTNNRICFFDNRTRSVNMIFISSAGDSAFYERVDTIANDDLKTADYEGSFYCGLIDATVKIKASQNELILSMKAWPDLKLKMLFADYFVNPEIGSFVFRRDRYRKIISVIYDSPRTRHLQFVKIGSF